VGSPVQSFQPWSDKYYSYDKQNPGDPGGGRGGFVRGRGTRSFEVVPLESVSETAANASIGDLNGDGNLDIVLAKRLALTAERCGFVWRRQGSLYTRPAAAVDRDEDLDVLPSNDQPDPKLILLNDGKAHFTCRPLDPRFRQRF
jgi:hypothetical protein